MTDSTFVRRGDRAPRLLLLLGQSPFDPTSGAAQSTRLIAEVLAQHGFDVRALATTGCEGELPADHAAVLAEMDLAVTAGPAGSFIRFEHAGVRHALVPVEPRHKHAWERHVGAAYATEYARLLADWRPDLVLTFGGDATDAERRRQAQHSGARVVFALHNLHYRKHPPAAVDAFLAPTHFLTNAYGRHLGAPVDVLPPPLDPGQVLAPVAEAKAVCFINPEPAKGALLVAQLADRLGRNRPDIPLLVVGGRVPASALVIAGRDLGLDLTRYPNLLQIPPTGRVSEIWGATRVVLMPSVVREAAGRCALEAMLNGAVPLVSDQGGLAEIVGDAGIRLPPPPDLTGRPQPVPGPIVEAWWKALIDCFDDQAQFACLSAAGRVVASRHTVAAVGPAYAAWFAAKLDKT